MGKLTSDWGAVVAKTGGQHIGKHRQPTSNTNLRSYDGPRKRSEMTWREWERAQQYASFDKRQRIREAAEAALRWRKTMPRAVAPEWTLFDECSAVATWGHSYQPGRSWWPSGDCEHVLVRVPEAHWAGRVLMCPRHTAKYHCPSWVNVGSPRPRPYAARGRASQELELMVQQWRESRA